MVSKKTEFCQIEHLEILLSVGKKYDIRGKSANAQLGKAQFFGDLLYFHGVSL